mgnify:CR=1 FL=1
MIKLIKLPILLGLLFSNTAFSSEILSVQEYVEKHQSDNQEAVTVYVSKRCAAIFLVTAKIVGESKKENKEVFDAMVNKGSELMVIAATLESEDNKSELVPALEEVNGQVQIMVDDLMQISDKSYARTGEYLSPHIEDLKSCRAIFEI